MFDTHPLIYIYIYIYIIGEQPNGDIEKYDATFTRTDENGYMLENEDITALSRENMLLRGIQLRNTNWAVGVVIATGKDTKILKNFADPPFKVSTMMKTLNYIVLCLFAFMVLICSICTIMTALYMQDENAQNSEYIWGGKFTAVNIVEESIWQFFIFFLLFAQFVPISLYVTIDIAKFIQSLIIAYDLGLYHEETDTPAIVKSLDLNEELGQVGHIFSDKTGTLTRNQMDFMKMSVNGTSYGLGVTEVGKNVLLRKGLPIPKSPPPDEDHPATANVNFIDPTIWEALQEPAHPNHEKLSQFLLSLALNHDVMPEYPDPDEPSNVIYSATSPDEGALVSAAKHFGYFFYRRTLKTLDLSINGEKQSFELLHTLAFSSKRKRSSVIIKNSDGKYILFCKGADNVITQRLKEASTTNEKTMVTRSMEHVQKFAADGLRTLLIAKVELYPDLYEDWAERYANANNSLINRKEKMEVLMDEVEKNLELLGVTGVEDRLQDLVPDSLRSIRAAGIHVWVLTGDKVETAVNIGHASSLLTTEMNCRYFTSGMESKLLKGKFDKSRLTEKILETIKECKENPEDEFAFIVDTKVLACIFNYELTKEFVELAEYATSLICARVSPSQKADVVSMMRKIHPEIVTLAIGDGANDVPMIQAAHVGIGISGNEGLQAVNASDFAIARFKFLKRLLLVHGRFNLRRIGNLGPYMFYKNILQVLPQFFFGFYNLFSGQMFYYDLIYQAFNIIYTSLPITVYGAFDKDVTAATAMKYPSLYQEGPNGAFFTWKLFGWWIFQSIFHSALIYYAVHYIFILPQFQNGQNTSIWHFGTLIHLCVVLTSNLKVFIMTKDFTIFVWISHLLSMLGWIVFLWFFCHEIWDEPRMFNIFETLFTSVSTYNSLFFIVITNIFVAYMPSAYTIIFRPYPSQVCAEIERGLAIGKNQVLPIVPDDPTLQRNLKKQKKLKIKRAKSAGAKLTAKEHIVQMVMAMFKKYDVDRSGSIGQSELKSILIDGGAAYGYDIFDEELESFVYEIDEDSEGEVSKFAFSSYATDVAMKSSNDLNEYREKGKLHQAFAIVISNAKDKLESRVLELQQIFEFYDNSGKGEINKEQFGHMLEDITADAESDDDEDEENDTHIRKTDVDMFIKALDKDGDGMVGQTEFLDYMLRGMSMTEAERKKFAKRSTMHGKLNRFVENILHRLDAEEL